jgi:hypothetical protein
MSQLGSPVAVFVTEEEAEAASDLLYADLYQTHKKASEQLEDPCPVMLRCWAFGLLLCHGLTFPEAEAVIVAARANPRNQSIVTWWESPIPEDMFEQLRRMIIREALKFLPPEHLARAILTRDGV